MTEVMELLNNSPYTAIPFKMHSGVKALHIGERGGLNDECIHKYTEAREAWGRKSFLSRCSEIAFETTCCIL